MSRPISLAMILLPLFLSTTALAAPGDVLLNSTFDNPPDDNWQPESGKWYYEDGNYCETTDGGGPLWSVAGKDNWSDYEVIFDLKSTDSGGRLYVAARRQDSDNYYAMQYDDRGGSIQIVKQLFGQEIVLARKAGVLDIGGGKNPHGRFRFVLQGPILKVCVTPRKDGKLQEETCILQAVDTTFKSGKIALGARERRGHWDMVKVVELAGPSAEQIAQASPVLTMTTRRTSFIRPNKGVLRFALANRSGLAMTDVTVHSRLLGVFGLTHTFKTIAGKDEVSFELPLDTRIIKAGDYLAKIEVLREGTPILQRFVPVSVQATPNPQRMDVINWTGLNRDIETHGFTATWFGPKIAKPYARPDLPIPVEASDPIEVQQSYDQYNRTLAKGMLSGLFIHNIGSRHLKVPEGEHIRRITAGGDKAGGINPHHPMVIQWADAWMDAVMKNYASFDGMKYVNVNSEWDRGLDYSPSTVALYRKQFGQEPPKIDAVPIDPKSIPAGHRPTGGIIESDNPYYTYFLWWSLEGKGYTTHNDRMHDIIKRYRPDMVTINEPVLRIPFIYGKAGKCDVAQDWSYAWPGPRSILYTMDGLVATKKVTGQKISHDIQILWKENWVAADAINPSPDIVRECLWMNMSRPSDLTFTWGTYLAIQDLNDPKSSVNPDTYAELKRFHETVTQPFGPMIRKTVSPPKPVGFLTCTATHVFLEGWRWAQGIHAMNFYDVLQKAGIHTDVLYEQDVRAGALADRGYKVVVLSYGQTLARDVYDKLVAFQQAGGKIVADQYLRADLPGVIKVDVDLEFYRRKSIRTVKPGQGVDEINKRIDAIAASVKKTIAPLYDADVTTNSDTVLVNRIEGANMPIYTFINDLRTKGEWAGRYNTIHDAGLPQTFDATIKVGPSGPDGPVFYNLMEHARVPDVQVNAGMASMKLTLGPGAGTYIVHYPEPIEGLKVEAAPGKSKTDAVSVEVLVLGRSGRPVPGLQPLKVTVLNGNGTPTEYSSYYCGENGRLAFSFQPAINEAGGPWQVIVEDLTAGLRGRAFVEVPRGKERFFEVTVPPDARFDLERWDRD